MPMDIEQAKGTSSVSEVHFSNVLYYFIKMYGDSVYFGQDKMKKALDTIEGMLAHYRYTVEAIYKDPKTQKWLDYDELKQKNLNDYQAAVMNLKKGSNYDRKLEELEYALLKEKFKALMLLVGRAQLLPTMDIIQDQD